jgi:phosphocarrier protein HPr
MKDKPTTATGRFIIINNHGMAGRHSAKFVLTVIASKSDVKVKKAGEDLEVNGNSIIGLLTLGCPMGTILEVSAEGEDAAQTINQLEALVADKFGFED